MNPQSPRFTVQDMTESSRCSSESQADESVSSRRTLSQPMDCVSGHLPEKGKFLRLGV